MYTALTHAARCKAFLREEDLHFVFTQEGLTAKGLYCSNELLTLTVEWIAAARVAEEREPPSTGARRGSIAQLANKCDFESGVSVTSQERCSSAHGLRSFSHHHCRCFVTRRCQNVLNCFPAAGAVHSAIVPLPPRSADKLIQLSEITVPHNTMYHQPFFFAYCFKIHLLVPAPSLQSLREALPKARHEYPTSLDHRSPTEHPFVTSPVTALVCKIFTSSATYFQFLGLTGYMLLSNCSIPSPCGQ